MLYAISTRFVPTVGAMVSGLSWQSFPLGSIILLAIRSGEVESRRAGITNFADNLLRVVGRRLKRYAMVSRAEGAGETGVALAGYGRLREYLEIEEE